MRDLAPDVFRQRMIIEGVINDEITKQEVVDLLNELCEELDMEKLSGPTVSLCEEYGWCGHMHWKTSGVHMYVWNSREPVFFSIDIYTCKPFDPQVAVRTVMSFFPDLKHLDWKEV